MPVYPISFSIPESKIVSDVPEKTKEIATIIPGNLKTYIYSDEKEYNQDYQRSLFGITCRKGGWDCLRHYEILANGCIPKFIDLEKCPSTIMTHFPKELIKEANESENPKEYIPRLLQYTREHLTCRAMAQYILTAIGFPNPNRVLFISNNLKADYLRCLTLTGFKQLLGKRCADYPVIPHLYDDFKEVQSLYGKGFNYTRQLPAELKTYGVDIREIQNHDFDLVIYGSLHRGLPLWGLVNEFYKPSEIIMLCGEDDDHNRDCCKDYVEQGYQVFIRELL